MEPLTQHSLGTTSASPCCCQHELCLSPTQQHKATHSQLISTPCCCHCHCCCLQDWATPLGTAPVDTSAVDFLAQQLTSSSSSHTAAAALINETPHSTEHSIENQLPFLVHGAAHGWDLAAAGCSQHNATTTSPEEAPAACSESTQQQHQQHQHQQQQDNEVSPAAATLSIVPISIGYLGNNQPHTMIQSIGAAVRALLLRLQQHADHQQHDNGQAVVLIVTSDFTHAGPWYRELPPAGVSLEDYMTAQDTPVLQVRSCGAFWCVWLLLCWPFVCCVSTVQRVRVDRDISSVLLRQHTNNINTAFGSRRRCEEHRGSCVRQHQYGHLPNETSSHSLTTISTETCPDALHNPATAVAVQCCCCDCVACRQSNKGLSMPCCQLLLLRATACVACTPWL